MKEDNKKIFGEYRKEALDFWRKETGRADEKECEESSIYEGAYECRWQGELPEPKHNSFFCSMGNFASNVDDLLTDSRRDEVDIQKALNDPENHDCGALYRFYTRILLVAETIVEDFEMVLQKDLPKSAKNLKKFVNAVIKHSCKNGRGIHFYKKNHHLPLLIEHWGFGDDDSEMKELSVDTLGKDDYNCLRLPSLYSIVESLLDCYKKLDEKLKDDDFAKNFHYTYTKTWD
ncbi:hypothetical protein H6771_03200 [Candidatus Peribacteria bacterium]|nr:hypothetical protein [Candidatus Peribacteria bacterium]